LRASLPQEESQNALNEKGLAPEEAAVAAALGREPLHIDDVVLKSRRPLAEVTGILLTLELKRRVKQLPGKYFVRA
jgi:DNA processing protein